MKASRSVELPSHDQESSSALATCNTVEAAVHGIASSYSRRLLTDAASHQARVSIHTTKRVECNLAVFAHLCTAMFFATVHHG